MNERLIERFTNDPASKLSFINRVKRFMRTLDDHQLEAYLELHWPHANASLRNPKHRAEFMSMFLASDEEDNPVQVQLASESIYCRLTRVAQYYGIDNIIWFMSNHMCESDAMDGSRLYSAFVKLTSSTKDTRDVFRELGLGWWTKDDAYIWGKEKSETIIDGIRVSRITYTINPRYVKTQPVKPHVLIRDDCIAQITRPVKQAPAHRNVPPRSSPASVEEVSVPTQPRPDNDKLFESKFMWPSNRITPDELCAEYFRITSANKSNTVLSERLGLYGGLGENAIIVGSSRASKHHRCVTFYKLNPKYVIGSSNVEPVTVVQPSSHNHRPINQVLAEVTSSIKTLKDQATSLCQQSVQLAKKATKRADKNARVMKSNKTVQAVDHCHPQHELPPPQAPLHKKNKYSRIAIEWLTSFNNPAIRHALNGGEYRIPKTRYSADGYDPITNTIYEFHGDFWHGNPAVYAPNLMNPVTGTTYGHLHSKTVKRQRLLKALGYNVIVIYEREYKLSRKR